jgi:hypothetical protein
MCLSYAESEALFWIVKIACSFVAALLSNFFTAAFLATDLSGSYIFIFGISLFDSGFPNEFNFIK